MATWQGTMLTTARKYSTDPGLCCEQAIAVDVNVSLNNLEYFGNLNYNTVILKSHENTTHTECTYTSIPFRSISHF